MLGAHKETGNFSLCFGSGFLDSESRSRHLAKSQIRIQAVAKSITSPDPDQDQGFITKSSKKLQFKHLFEQKPSYVFPNTYKGDSGSKRSLQPYR
jgi:hypothetical protein